MKALHYGLRFVTEPGAMRNTEMNTRLGSNAVPLAVFFVSASFTAAFIDDRFAIVLLSIAGAAECGALILRRSHFDRPTSRIWNGFLGLAAATAPWPLVAWLASAHDLAFFRVAAVAFATVALLFAMYGGGLMAGPGFRSPAVARLLTVFLAGFLLSGVAVQWAWALGNDRSGVANSLEYVAALGALFSIVSVVPLARQMRRHGRTAESWCLAAGTLWTLGQVVFVAQQSDLRIGTASSPAFAAIGVVVASAWLPGAETAGRSIESIESGQPTRVAAIVLLAAMSASIALVVPVKIGWGSWASVALSTVAIAQTALLAWFVTSAAHPRSMVSFGKTQRAARRDLRNALVRGELVPYYQPVYRAIDAKLAGYECLVRWNHPRLGVLSAARFLDVARDDHLLDSIDRLMMTATLDNLDTLLSTTSVDEPFVSVNIHPERFAGEHIVDELRSALRSRKRDGTGLVVELTEHTAIENWERFTTNVTAIQRLGVGVAVDDFGMGNANYSLLMQCDPDFVKLDKSLVSASKTTERGRLLLKSAFDAASAVGAMIVAEGIEDHATMADLRALGAHYFQGYALGSAQSFEAVTHTTNGRILGA
jgi:EAL domain-containing protein (putative c-di-GMP-specific phosphodiesterase class I)